MGGTRWEWARDVSVEARQIALSRGTLLLLGSRMQMRTITLKFEALGTGTVGDKGGRRVEIGGGETHKETEIGGRDVETKKSSLPSLLNPLKNTKKNRWEVSGKLGQARSPTTNSDQIK